MTILHGVCVVGREESNAQKLPPPGAIQHHLQTTAQQRLLLEVGAQQRMSSSTHPELQASGLSHLIPS